MKNLYGDLGNSDRKASKKEIGSDAVLNCPSCFVTLCRDCQRYVIKNSLGYTTKSLKKALINIFFLWTIVL